ncbi:MAG TPA: alpha-glucuronidase family glycosyl hydrolase [Candidatus Hydrogenedentes bacterium]|nr:alpha-glucuronidase family glycosyl hydrolase [Candidatus Hydrogenedentota bacterium]HRK33692.1 alpha-glucuronidase family glycosyl hydrolase [Candidatus Hydrogenedentota bacterium]
MRKFLGVVAMVFCCLAFAIAEEAIDLTNAVIVAPRDGSTPERNAADMLTDEIASRTMVRLPIQHEWPTNARPVILLGTVANMKSVAGPLGVTATSVLPEKPEGFVLRTATAGSSPVVIVLGKDARGLLFGVGRLLRESHMARGAVTVKSLSINTAPQVPLRGHQLGYRPKVNTYDAWTDAMFEQYYRDLIVFGTNAVELIPPRSDDAADSPHFTLPQIDMMVRMSQLAKDYDMKLWIWYPAMDKDYGNKSVVDTAIAEWAEVFKRLPHIDVVFVPGGDPGHTQPKHLMALLEKQTESLHKFHPNAQMWMSPQGFNLEWTEEFLEIMQKQQPSWLSGIVFAPQNRLSLSDLRAAMPKQYPIRHYPDITHTYSCQYPVIDWDVSLKLTHDREQINPRPLAYAEIFRWSNPYCDGGFITYSEGVNDDVNKILWSALGWDPEADVQQVMREFGRYFIGAKYEETIAKALFGLEQNWVGPLDENKSIAETLALVQSIEQAKDPHVLLNWRFQQIAYRAYFDAYVQQRAAYEAGLEREAMEVLLNAKRSNALEAVDKAQDILDQAKDARVAPALRERVSNLAEALYHSIRMQTSVSRFMAIDIGRGASFDFLDRPLNNRLWLEPRFAAIRAMTNSDDRMKAIDEIVNWANPGPGGFYDDLGDPRKQPHLVRDVTKDFDPETRINPLLGYYPRPFDRRISWFDDAETRFEAPLYMRYDNLDPEAEYKVRAVYAGDKWDTQMKLVADGILVHDLIDKPEPIAPLEFDIPKDATKDGNLTLEWTQTPGRGSAGRGCQVAEVWLIKK